MNYRSCMERIGSKSGKIAKSGQISEGVPVHVQGCTGTPHQRPKCTSTYSGCTGTPHQKPTCTGTCPTCTGTCQQNATCTGTCSGCTGACVPKMLRMLCFCVIKPEFVH